jgi:hypothetical protein
MRAQLLVSEKIEYDEENQRHHLGYIINHYEVDTLPCVCNFNLYVKLQSIPVEEALELQIGFRADNGKLAAYSNRVLVRNRRPKDQIPGIDCVINMSVVITRKGNYNFELFVDAEKKEEYPIKIRVKDLEFI